MNLFFLYYACMYDRSVGQIFTHDTPYTEKEFNDIVAGLIRQHGAYEYKIGECLVQDYGFTRPNVVKCNTEDILMSE